MPEQTDKSTNFAALPVNRLVEIINTLLPDATNRRQLQYFRERWGRNVANADGTLHFVKLAQRLRVHWEEHVTAAPVDMDAHRERARQRRRSLARDIGEIPVIADKRLRKQCDKSLRTFLLKMFPDVFHLKFSKAHNELIESIEDKIETGGNRAYACERGFGKTQISIGACMWGTLTGRTPYSLLIGANSEMATSQRDGIVRRLETSEPLFNTYPEVCFPMRSLAGSTKNMATYRGELLRVKYRPDLILPRIDGSPASEAVIACTGIDSGSIRGRYYDRADGTTVRPTLVMLDDPQDDNTARSEPEVTRRSKKIRQAVQGVAGPGVKLAILMPCTVIVKGDLAWEFTDNTLRPEYGGIRVPALQSFPTDLDEKDSLWRQYDEIRREDLAAGDKTRARATEFYLAHHKQMNAGAVLTWPDRVEANCVDALQSLMDKYLTDRLAFMAEQQQQPEGEDDLSIYLDDRGLASRFNGLTRGIVPPGASVITTGIDVQEHLLYWAQIAWADDLTGWLVDWGTWPRQPAADFHHLTPPRTMRQWLAQEFPRQAFTWEEGLKMGIRACVDSLRKYKLESGPMLIDWRWHKSRKPIAAVCSEDELAGKLLPAGGMSVGGNDIAISARPMPPKSSRPGTDIEWYWKKEAGEPRGLFFDANFYRSQLHKALATNPGEPGSLTYNSRLPDTVLAHQLGAKLCKIPPDKKREVEIWTNKPGRDQDHWLDSAVMARVAAEVHGLRVTGVRAPRSGQRRRAAITQADVNRMRGRR